MIAVIEIPKDSYLKYEINKVDGTLLLDRVLNQPIPYNYGFILNTLCADGDALDVFVVLDHSLQPLSQVKIKFIGVLVSEDNGISDDKIIATLQNDDPVNFVAIIDNIKKYLHTYKKGFLVKEVLGAEAAHEIYKKSLING